MSSGGDSTRNSGEPGVTGEGGGGAKGFAGGAGGSEAVVPPEVRGTDAGAGGEASAQ